MKTTDKYIPIDCGFYDRIEAAIVRRKVVRLEYLAGADRLETIETRLADTRARSGEEFLILPAGEEIRMDRIVSLDGVAVPKSC